MNEKQKIEGVDNKELYGFIAIIAVLAILLMFEFFFFKGSPKVANEQAQMQEELQAMSEVTVATEQKTVYKELNNVVEMMNNKDYKGLYSMLKDDYKNYCFSEYADFEAFIQKYARERYYPKYNSYYRDGNRYYITVDFLKEKYTREDLLKPMAFKVDTLVLEELDDGSFKFALNGFVENIYHNSSQTINGVTFTLLNSIRNTETTETTVVIENNSSKTLVISTANLQPDIVGGISAKISATSVITVEPGNVGVLSIEYYMQYNSNKELAGLTVAGAKFEDGTVIKDVYLSK